MLGLALVVAMAGVGCGDDDDTVPTDAGTDSGTDSGMRDTGMPDEDAGTDAGPPPTPEVFVRIAHLSPNAGSVRVCTETIVGGEPSGVRGGPLPPAGSEPIPFRGISGYLAFPLPAGVDGYRVLIFRETAENPVTSCTGEPIFDETFLLGEDIEAERYYTAAAMGFVGDAASWPAVCGAPTFNSSCAEQDIGARLLAFEDDSMLVATATKIRAVHGIPNAPPVQICYDPDGSEGEMEPIVLFDRLPFGASSNYFSSDTAITSGSLRIFNAVPPEAGEIPDCQTVVVGEMPVRMQLVELDIPDDFEPLAAGFDLPQVVTSFALNRISTVFAQGILGVSFPADGFAAFVPWQDLPEIEDED